MNHARWSWALDSAELGAAVRRARIARGLQQVDLADLLGVSRMTVSRLERGESVAVDTSIRALSECGMAVAVVPKFSRLVVDA
jgi:HTH-type transcriptional regulator/antitoxin HipB